MTVGAELAQARAGLGLSLDDISTRTKISVERLTAIEQEDVAALPPFVYLKGFVREYAAAVDLDPDDVTRRYVAALDDVAGLMSATVPELPLAPAEHEFSSTDAARIVQPRSPAATRSLLGIDDVPPLEGLGQDAFPSEFDPVSAPLRSSPVGRMAIVVVVAALGGFLLSSQTGRLSTWWASDTAPKAPVTSTPTERGDASRAAQSLPADAPPKPDEVETAYAPTQRDSAPVAPAPRTAPVAPSAPVAPKPAAPVAPSAPAAPKPAAPVAPSAPAAPEPAAPVAPVLSGSWALTTRIESTDYEAFNNMNLGYRLQLRQEGDRITGSGLKWMENGKPIPARSRTPIEIEGIRRGDRIELRFTEHGALRTSTGTFVLVVGDDGTLRGQFASTSANSGGSSVARRVAPQPR